MNQLIDVHEQDEWRDNLDGQRHAPLSRCRKRLAAVTDPSIWVSHHGEVHKTVDTYQLAEKKPQLFTNLVEAVIIPRTCEGEISAWYRVAN